MVFDFKEKLILYLILTMFFLSIFLYYKGVPLLLMPVIFVVHLWFLHLIWYDSKKMGASPVFWSIIILFLGAIGGAAYYLMVRKKRYETE